MPADSSIRSRQLAKRLLRGVWRRAPGQQALARRAARLPPEAKARLYPLLDRLLREELPQVPALPTNLGIYPRTLIEIGTDAPSVLFFGTPEHYRGERGALRLCAALAPACDAFVDVGANHGYFTHYVRRHAPAVPIHFVEPNPALHAEIEAGVRAAGLHAVEGHALALGAHDGRDRFYLDDTDPSMSSLVAGVEPAHRLRPVDVQVQSFATFARAQGLRRALVKVDVENAEDAFLAGVGAGAERIDALVIEVLGPAIAGDFVRRAQRALGMQAYYVDDLCLEHSPDGHFRYVEPQYNWLFCREDPAALRSRLAGRGLRVRTASGAGTAAC